MSQYKIKYHYPFYYLMKSYSWWIFKIWTTEEWSNDLEIIEAAYKKKYNE